MSLTRIGFGQGHENESVQKIIIHQRDHVAGMSRVWEQVPATTSGLLLPLVFGPLSSRIDPTAKIGTPKFLASPYSVATEVGGAQVSGLEDQK